MSLGPTQKSVFDIALAASLRPLRMARKHARWDNAGPKFHTEDSGRDGAMFSCKWTGREAGEKTQRAKRDWPKNERGRLGKRPVLPRKKIRVVARPLGALRVPRFRQGLANMKIERFRRGKYERASTLLDTRMDAGAAETQSIGL